MPEKKSDTQTKELEDGCQAGTKKELEGGGFTCQNKDGKWVTCIPNRDNTSNCWVSTAPLPPGMVDAFIRVREALGAIETAIDNVISSEDKY